MYSCRVKSKRLVDVAPHVSAEWHPTLNTSPLDTISYGSGKLVWWKCQLGHDFQQKVNNRTSGNQGCPYCSGRKALVGYNDLLTTHPEISREWSIVNDRPVTSVSSGSDYVATWDAPCGHRYTARVSRKVAGHGCSVCFGSTVQSGVNDLKSQIPEIAAEWDYKSNNIGPDKVLFRSSKKYSWICSNCKKSWTTSVRSRVVLGTSCPSCSQQNTPKVLIELAKLLSGCEVNKRLDNVRWPSGQRLEVDILWGDTVIEYDGDRWHTRSKREDVDERKTKILVESGYIVYRLREGRCSLLNYRHPNFKQAIVKWSLDPEYWHSVLSNLVTEYEKVSREGYRSSKDQ